MSDDKRKVSTDALETLGTIIGPDEKRDAIHLAVIPMQARFTLAPGDNVNAQGEPFKPYIGIVDPFLVDAVVKGEWFWLVIYPRQITSLRHVWSHPSFSEEATEPVKPDVGYSESWLRGWLDRSDCGGLTYEKLLQIGQTGSSYPDEDPQYYGDSYSVDGDYLYTYGRTAHGAIPPEVWDHVENVIGRPVTARPTYFSCSC